jgi:hypothetical protein
MSANITAYSVAVGPSSLFRNDFARFRKFCIGYPFVVNDAAAFGASHAKPVPAPSVGQSTH